MKAVITIFFFLFALGLFAQKTIHGQVTDEYGVAIKGVSISVKSTDVKVFSDSDGKYTIDVPKGYETLEFYSKGYHIQLLEITQNELNLNLVKISDFDVFELSLEDLLNTPVITASKKEQKISEIPASVMVLTRKDIELFGFTNLGEIFSHISGLYFVNNASFLGPTIGVRGYMTANPTNIVVLLNGVPQQNDLHNAFSFHITPIPPEAIDRIEVIRGPMSVVYGSNAFLGAINIITNEPVTDGATTSKVSLSKGNIGKTRALLTSKGKMGFIDYSLSFSYNKDGGIDEPFSKMVTDFSNKFQQWGIDNENVTSKGYFTGDQKYIQFSGKFKDLYFETAYAASQFGQTFSSLFYLPAQCKSYFSKSAIGFRHKFSEKFEIDAKISYARYDLLMEDNYYTEDTTGFGNENDIYSYGQYWSEKAEGEINLFYKPTRNLNLSFTAYHAGILDVGDKTDAPYSGAVNLLNRSGGVVEGDVVNIMAYYSQIEYHPFERINVVLGGRLEKMGPFDLVLYRAMYYPEHQKFEGQFKNNEFHFVPRAALIANLSKRHTIKLMYGEAHKLPAIWELRNNLTVNQSLDHETIKTYEFNYVGTFSDNLAASLSIFSNSIEDVVQRSIIFNGSNYFSYFTNGAKIRTNGFGANVTCIPARNLKFEISVVYQESKYMSVDLKNVKVEFSPNLLGYLKASYHFNKNFSIALLGNYVDKMEAQWDNTPVNPSDPESPPIGRYGQTVDAYFLLGANIRYQNIPIGKTAEDKGLYLNLKAENLLNAEYHYPSTSVSAWADKGVLGYGRAILFSAGYTF